MQRLGAAVIVHWSSIPRDVQELLVQQAIALGETGTGLEETIRDLVMGNRRVNVPEPIQ